MVSSQATTPDEYVAGVPDERRAIVQAVRSTILEQLPEGFGETMSFGMIGYVVPLSDTRTPTTVSRSA